MKQAIFILAAFLAIPVFALAQTDSNWESKNYPVKSFTKLYVEGGYKIYLQQGNACGLTVKATGSDVFDVLKIDQFGDELRLDVKRENFDFDRINLYVTFQQLESIRIEGGVSLKTKGYLDLNDLEMRVEGGAKIDLDLKAEDIKITGEGGVLFDLSGVAESLDVRVTGAGHVDAIDLKTKDVNFYIEGVGSGSVYATDVLNARIEGVGKIRYKGDPKVTQYIDGLGSVKRD